MRKSKLRKLVKFITVSATVLLFALVCTIVFQYIKIANLKRDIANIDTEIIKIQDQRLNLENDINNRSSNIYIEEYARNELGMLDSDETKIEFE